MRSAFAMTVLAAGAAAAPEAAAKKGPLITTGVVGTFLQESIALTRDLSVFSVSTGANMVWGVIPPEQQKLISEQYSTAYDQLETLRLQNGLMKPSEIYGEASGQFKTKVVPAVQKAYDVVTKAAEKPFGFVKTFITNFEKAYPEHQGLLSSVSIWDFLLTLFFVVYFILGYSKRAFCYFVCCGMCKKRASAKPQLVKKASPPLKANGVSKKR